MQDLSRHRVPAECGARTCTQKSAVVEISCDGDSWFCALGAGSSSSHALRRTDLIQEYKPSLRFFKGPGVGLQNKIGISNYVSMWGFVITV